MQLASASPRKGRTCRKVASVNLWPPFAATRPSQQANTTKKKGQVCEANFYSGELALRQDAKDEAARLFRLAASDCAKDFDEWVRPVKNSRRSARRGDLNGMLCLIAALHHPRQVRALGAALVAHVGASLLRAVAGDPQMLAGLNSRNFAGPTPKSSPVSPHASSGANRAFSHGLGQRRPAQWVGVVAPGPDWSETRRYFNRMGHAGRRQLGIEISCSRIS